MNTIKEIKLDQTNWLEVTIVNEEGTIIHCESFGDSDEYQALVMQRCSEFGIELSEDNLLILSEQKAKRKVLTEEELAETNKQNRISELNIKIQEVKMYLSNTSWIWEKYSRNVLVLKDTTEEDFNTKYQDIISKQEQCRLDINKYEKDILNLEGVN